MASLPKSLDSLFRDLLGNDGKAINAAAAAFGDLTTPDDREQAFHRLAVILNDPNPWFRLRAVFALHHLGDRRAIDLFLNTLDDVPDDDDIKYEIFEAKFDALTSRQLLDKRSMVPLINRLDRIEFKTAWSLYAFKPDLLRPLCDALSHQSQQVRWQAAYLLGNLRDARAAKPLQDALGNNDNHYGVAGQIITSLGWLGATSAIETVMGHANSPHDGVRMAVASALGLLGDAAAIPVLMRLLNDDSERVRKAANESLSTLLES